MAFGKNGPVPASEFQTDEVCISYIDLRYSHGRFALAMNAWMAKNPTKRIFNVKVVTSHAAYGDLKEMIGIIFFVDAESTYMKASNE